MSPLSYPCRQGQTDLGFRHTPSGHQPLTGALLRPGLLMIDFQSATARAKDQLSGFPPELVESYLSYSKTGEYAHLDSLILGMLEFYLSTPPAEHLSSMPGTTRLIQDLGCDSLAMVETLFMVESLFDIRLTDDEMSRILTLDDLRQHLRSHIERTQAPAS